MKKMKKLLLLAIIIVTVTIFIFVIKMPNNSVEKANKHVNEDKVQNINENKFQNTKYYIEDNLKRYKNYAKTNPDLSNELVVSYVNANLDKTKYVDCTETDTSLDILMLVNKYYYLSSTYTPNDLVTLNNTYNIGANNSLRKEAADAFIEMSNAALIDNIIIKNASGFRSYDYQVNLYNKYVQRDGKEAADTYSARAGFSEHQTGLCTDINLIDQSFENTDAFKWLSDNAYKYGYILRFPKDKENITGYTYEPWHYRYVGKEAALKIKNENITLEEYYAYYVIKH